MIKHNIMKKFGAIMLSAPMVIAMAGCGSASSTEQAESTTEAAQQENTKILIAAAASLEATFENELIPMFEEQNPGIEVEGTYASSGDLQHQIEAGLEADVFMSAATSNMDTLVEEGLVDEATVVDLLKNDVVLIVPKDIETTVIGFEDIQNADTVAIGDPESVPAGKYAKEILTNLGNYDAVAEKASFGTSVTEVCTWVAEGSAEAGIVYSTDALNENSNGDDKEVTVLATAEDSMMDTPVIYPVGLTASSAQQEAVRKLVDFLQTEGVMNVFVENGFTANN